MILVTVTPEPGGWLKIQPAAYHEAVRAQFKGLPGAVWDRVDRAYRAPEEVAFNALETLRKARVVKVRHQGEALAPPPKTLTLEQAAEVLRDLPARFHALRHYQLEGAAFMAGWLERAGSALLCDDTGTGKSAQVLAAWALLHPRPRRVLVVCPAVVCAHWAAQVKQWTGQDAVRLRQGLLPGAGFNVASYEALRDIVARAPDAALLGPEDLLVIDEIHYTSNARAARSRAVRTVAEKSRAKLIGLSGTPMTARVRDMWHPLSIVFPKRFGSYFNFTQRYCAGYYDTDTVPDKAFWVSDGSSNEEELAARLQHVMLRRDVSVLDLPERNRILFPVELSRTGLAQVLEAARHATSDRDLSRVLAATEAHKLDAAVTLAKALMAEKRNVLVYTMLRSTANEIAERLGVPAATGAVNAAKRKKLLDSGLRPEGGGGAVATIYSVTTGIDLVGFDVALFVGLDHVPANLLQAEGRIHRMGQARGVTIYYLVGLRTPDEVIRQRVIQRLGYYARIVGTFKSAEELSTALNGVEDADDLSDLTAVVREAATRAVAPDWLEWNPQDAESNSAASAVATKLASTGDLK